MRNQRSRLDDEILFATNVSTVIERALYLTGHWVTSTVLESFDNIRHVEFPRRVFDEIIHDPIVIEALANLDIDPNDNKKLNDILDPDRDGRVHILDLVTGLMRLRGQPRRSDVVCVDLMVRSLQAT